MTAEIHNTKDIIYVSSIPWDFSWHRQQEMMAYMAEHGFRVLFIEPCDKKHPFQKIFKQERKNIWRLRPCGFPYERCSGFINGANAKISNSEIEKAEQQLKFENPILWMDRVHGFDFEYYQKNHFVVYDLVDEILAFGRVRNDRMLLNLENRVLKRADVLISSSQTLMTRKIAQSGRTGTSVFLPNGVDCKRFEDVLQKQTRDDRGLTLGFIGEISKRRLNFGLIGEIAKKRRGWEIILVGPGNKTDKAELSMLAPNVQVRDSVNGKEIPAVIEMFDVGIIPYNTDKSDMDYIFPRKACEFLAAGRAVVSTPLKEVSRMKPYVSEAVDADQFIERIESAAYNTIVTAEDRRAFAQKYDWNNLMKGLLAVL